MKLNNTCSLEGKLWQILLLFSHTIMSSSLPPHGLQHSRLPCPSPSPRACSNSCSLSQWCIQPSHPLLPPSLPAFNLSPHEGFSNELALWIRWPKYWSFNFSINISNEYSGLMSFRIDSLLSKGLSRVFSNTTVQRHQFFSAQPYVWSNSRQCIKKQRHHFTGKRQSSQNYGFSLVMYWCKSWTIKKAECWRIDAFKLWC